MNNVQIKSIRIFGASRSVANVLELRDNYHPLRSYKVSVEFGAYSEAITFVWMCRAQPLPSAPSLSSSSSSSCFHRDQVVQRNHQKHSVYQNISNRVVASKVDLKNCARKILFELLSKKKI